MKTMEENEYKRIKKCYTLFKVIRNNLKNDTGRTELVFKDILETAKCDNLSDFTKTRNSLFKDISIMEKLQNKRMLNSEEALYIEELRKNKKECIIRSINNNIRNLYPLNYYTEEINWESVCTKIILAERSVAFFRFVFSKFFRK